MASLAVVALENSPMMNTQRHRRHLYNQKNGKTVEIMTIQIMTPTNSNPEKPGNPAVNTNPGKDQKRPKVKNHKTNKKIQKV